MCSIKTYVCVCIKLYILLYYVFLFCCFISFRPTCAYMKAYKFMYLGMLISFIDNVALMCVSLYIHIMYYLYLQVYIFFLHVHVCTFTHSFEI